MEGAKAIPPGSDQPILRATRSWSRGSNLAEDHLPLAIEALVGREVRAARACPSNAPSNHQWWLCAAKSAGGRGRPRRLAGTMEVTHPAAGRLRRSGPRRRGAVVLGALNGAVAAHGDVAPVGMNFQHVPLPAPAVQDDPRLAGL